MYLSVPATSHERKMWLRPSCFRSEMPIQVWHSSRLLATVALRLVTTALRFQPLPLTGLPLSHFVRRGRKGNLLLLCVAEQYRGAVELCETEGLKNQHEYLLHLHRYSVTRSRHWKCDRYRGCKCPFLIDFSSISPQFNTAIQLLTSFHVRGVIWLNYVYFCKQKGTR